MSRPARRRAVLVVGSGRSGTSLTTRILGMLGVHLGPTDRMLSPDATDNPSGYWEQAPLARLNEDLLEKHGGSWYQPPDLAGSALDDPALDPEVERARALVALVGGDAPLWGFKDPRTALVLPFWQRALADHDLSYVICLRNPAEVAQSLAARGEEAHPLEQSARMWLTVTRCALAGTSGGRRALVFHDRIFADQDRQIDELAALAGTEPEPHRAAIAAFADPGLHRRHAMIGEPAGQGPYARDAALLFAALRALPDLPPSRRREQLNAITGLVARRTLPPPVPEPARTGDVAWLTGLPAAGKSTVARLTAQRLRADGWRVDVLDGDEVRAGLSHDLGYDDDARAEQARRLAWVADRLSRQGVTVIVAAISPHTADRAAARERLGERFIEVHVDTPLEVCRSRDPKGLYARADRGELSGLTGLDGVYEPPDDPEVVVPTAAESAEHSAGRVVAALRERLIRNGVLLPPT